MEGTGVEGSGVEDSGVDLFLGCFFCLSLNLFLACLILVSLLALCSSVSFGVAGFNLSISSNELYFGIFL